MKNHFEIKEVKKDKERIYFDFFIDKKALSERLSINRFDLSYCDFDLDTFEVDKFKFPNYDRSKVNKNAVFQFLGNHKPLNQFKTNRIVLYRCHCGCDYCGVISFNLEKQDDLIVWKDITYEDDDFEYEEEMGNIGIKPIKELMFDRRAYELAFENYLKKYCA
ncbi:hypothetical protein ATO12_03495 [Aquimarina atlantica]|uniref:Uncharacterized protein n=1 Tax=Aquimarina atlantica TaxID=1317122 RepID=A0A023C0L6_9FLAO|nr:hypothetical protein [Aquimarina atlantica]EZH75867.1 hypothetical protein ATO12_03495 [Aquimarina atlantica]